MELHALEDKGPATDRKSGWQRDLILAGPPGCVKRKSTELSPSARSIN